MLCRAPGLALHLIIILCFLTGLNAGPVHRSKEFTSSLDSIASKDRPPTLYPHTVSIAPPPRPTKFPPTDNVKVHGQDLTAALLERDEAHLAALGHDYALVCDDRTWTSLCASIGYTCNASGKLKYSQKDIFCDDTCKCVNLRPTRCIVTPTILTCLVEDGVALDAINGSFIGNVSNARVVDDNTYDFTSTVANRAADMELHTFALVCLSDGASTIECSRSGYSCNSNGVVIRSGPIDYSCDSFCWCPNLQIAGGSCHIGSNTFQCNLVNGIARSNVTGQIIGNVSDAHTLADGSLYFRGPAVKRDQENYLHNYALVCENRDWTFNCARYFAYTCNANGKVITKQEDMWCQAICTCVNLKRTGSCIVAPQMSYNCLIVDGIARHVDSFKAIGNIADAVILANSTFDFSQALAKRDSETSLAAQHSYALVCHDRRWTNFCAGSRYQYYCTSTGSLANKAIAYDFCQVTCQCVDLEPRKCILSPYILASCLVRDDVVYEINGTFVGTISHSHAHSDGTLDFVNGLAERDQDVEMHDYALVCDDRAWTRECQGSPYGYTCTINGKITYKQSLRHCSRICSCVNVRPKIGACLTSPYFQGVCLIEDGSAYFLNGSRIGDINDAEAYENGTFDFTGTMAKRAQTHDYALVCDDREVTRQCQDAFWGYYCTSQGKVRYKRIAGRCDASCECVNLRAKVGACIISPYLQSQCLIQDTTAYDLNGTLIGDIADANILLDGTFDFTPTTTVIAKRKQDTEMHDHALVCGDREITRDCANNAGYYCNSTGKVQRQYIVSYCDESCTCVNVRSRLGACLMRPYYEGMCLIQDTSAYHLNGTLIGNISDAIIDPDGVMDFTHVTAIAKREEADASHSFTLVCYDREWTTICQGSLFQYYCTAKGGVKHKRGPHVLCNGVCKCVDLNLRQCIKTPWLTTTCLVKSDGVFDVDDTFIGHVADAHVRQNGILDFSTTSAKRGIYDMYCVSDERLKDDSLTAYCSSNGYSCVQATEDSVGSILYAGSKGIERCDANCRCPLLFVRDSTLISRSENEITTAVTTPAPVDGIFSMICLSQGTVDKVLTDHCQSREYSCTQDSSSAFPALHHQGAEDDECEHNCQCSSPFTARSEQSKSSNFDAAELRASEKWKLTCKHIPGIDLARDCISDYGYKCDSVGELTASGPRMSRCDALCHCNHPSHEGRSFSLQHSSTLNDVPDATLDAPPSGVPSFAADNYTLSCGNRQDGPSFCRQENLGYFCEPNGKVSRTSTELSPSVTWCNYYCRCICTHPVPCVNEWNIPMCLIMADGTVRDASRPDLVLGTLDTAVELLNGSLLLDRGSPYIVSSNASYEFAANNETANGTTNGTVEVGYADVSAN